MSPLLGNGGGWGDTLSPQTQINYLGLLNVILGMCFRMFLDEINNRINGLSKADCPP